MPGPTGTERRKAALARGRGAEWRALIALALKGYRPVARNVGGVGGEIDLVMRRGRTVIFVEVKARGSLMAGVEAIGAQKQRLIGQAARRWLAANGWAMGFTLRADVVVIVPGRWPHHIPDAFPLGL